MTNKLKVVFPGGRVSYLDPKTADSKTVRRMGGVVVTAPEPIAVPKAYAKPLAAPIVETEEDFEPVDFTAPAPVEDAPAKKPMGRPKKVKA